MADELAAMVRIGRKRATAGLLESYTDKEPMPVIGGHLVVTSSKDVPVALVRTVQIDTFAFRDVPAWFAEREGEDEGEGAVCLASWKRGHSRWGLTGRRSSPGLNREPSPTIVSMSTRPGATGLYSARPRGSPDESAHASNQPGRLHDMLRCSMAIPDVGHVI